MKIFKKFGKLTSYVAILSLLSQMFVGVVPVFASSSCNVNYAITCPQSVVVGAPATVSSGATVPADFTYNITNNTNNNYSSLKWFLQISNTNQAEIKTLDYVDGNNTTPIVIDQFSEAVGLSLTNASSLAAGGSMSLHFQIAFNNLIDPTGTETHVITFGPMDGSQSVFTNRDAIFTVTIADTVAPTVIPPVTHNEIAKTITYNFSEPVQLRDSSSAIIAPSDYALRLGIYNLADYAAHIPGTQAPDTNGTITSAVLSGDSKSLAITYTGLLIKKTDTTYIVDAWGNNITDLAGNKMPADASTQSFTVLGDSTPPTATVAHNETDKTITYTFSEPVQLMDSSDAVVPPTDYALRLGIYNLADYAAHIPGTQAPDTDGGTITSAVLSPDRKTMTVTYDGLLVEKTDTTYIIDAWGYNITDLVGNKMPADASTQSFTVLGDSTPPTATVAHNETDKTITYTFSEQVVLSDAMGNVLPSSEYVSSLAIYNKDTYLAHKQFTPEPDHAAGVNITDASLVGNVMTITYTGSLIKNVDTSYIVDAWGNNITDLVGNKMAQDSEQIFLVKGDTAAPVLTILGSSPIQVTVGTAYSDAGATALDAADGSLTSKITTTSTVDTSKIGSYTVIYSVIDSAGHSVSTTRIVNVVAAEVPATTSATTGSTDTTGTSSTPTDTTTVASTDTASIPEVKGTSTTKDNSDQKTDPGFFGSTWLGVYTWIWLLGAAAAIGGGAWWLFGARRQD